MKRAVLLVSMLMTAVCIFAGSLDYVFGNNLSSVSFEEKPSPGSVFRDPSGSLLIARHFADNQDNVTVFDIRYCKGSFEQGCELEKRGPVSSMNVMGGTRFALAMYSLTTPLYPFEPLAVAGVDYSAGKILPVFGAGFRMMIPLANLWDSSFTLIGNGKITGWCAVGAEVSDTVIFAGLWGFSYRHNLGFFNWEAGYSRMIDVSGRILVSPYIGLGADL